MLAGKVFSASLRSGSGTLDLPDRWRYRDTMKEYAQLAEA